jgi:pyruvate dehydrogenase E1 component alpha subunit
MTDVEIRRRELLYKMLRIRMIEEAIADLYPDQEMRCPVHLSIGQEAPAVGVCSALGTDDWVLSNHRSHAHYLARGGSLERMLAELYGKATGCTGGLGGSMHLTDLEVGFIGSTPIVGSSVPIAVGAALTAHLRGLDRIVVVFLGDAAMETGIVHESLNVAAVHSLPVLFCCENNLYSVYSPLSVRQPAHRTLSDLASGHGIRTISGDGNDVEEVYEIASEAHWGISQGDGPIFIELSTYRLREHCGPNFDNDLGYRSEEEYMSWQMNDPIKRLVGKISWNERDTVTQDIRDEIEQAIAFAKASEFPDPEIITYPVYR